MCTLVCFSFLFLPNVGNWVFTSEWNFHLYIHFDFGFEHFSLSFFFYLNVMHINLTNIKLADNRQQTTHFNRKKITEIRLYLFIYIMIWFNALEICKRTKKFTLKMRASGITVVRKNKTTIHFTVWPSIRPRNSSSSGGWRRQRWSRQKKFHHFMWILHGRDKLIYYALIDRYKYTDLFN